MPWARLDDGFDDHPKVLELADTLEPHEFLMAIGLWTLTLTWAHRNTRKFDGKLPSNAMAEPASAIRVPGGIPRGLVRRCGGTPELAGHLVRAKLWEVVEGGWLIHDFDQYLPDMSTREARAAAGRKGAESRWKDKTAGADGNLPSASHDGDSNGMASDGYARARPTPIPTPIPEGVNPLPPTPRADPPEEGEGGGSAGFGGEAAHIVDELPFGRTPPGKRRRSAMAGAIANALAAGWTSGDLVAYLTHDVGNVRSLTSVYEHRLKPDELPNPPRTRAAREPPWCGECDERYRTREDDEGAIYPCPTCNPRSRNHPAA